MDEDPRKVIAEALERAEKATEGPWVDYARPYTEAISRYRKAHKAHYHGSGVWWVHLIASGRVRGEPVDVADFPHRTDTIDLRPVLEIRRSRRKSAAYGWDGVMRPDNLEFICHARTDVPALARIATEALDELDTWKSVFPDVAPERVMPDRSVLEARCERLRAVVKCANFYSAIIRSPSLRAALDALQEGDIDG